MTICTATYVGSYRYSEFMKALPPLPCFKSVDESGRHRGQHQTFEPNPAPSPSPFEFSPFEPDPQIERPPFIRLVSWNGDGSSSSQVYDPAVSNTNCMCVMAAKRGDEYQLRILGHRPEDHRWARCLDCSSIIDTRTDEAQCFMCGEWAKRVREARSGEWKYLRPHDSNTLYSFSASNPGGYGGKRFTVTMDDGTVIAKDRAGLWCAGSAPWWVEEEFPPNCTIESGSGSDLVPGHTTGFGGAGRPLTYTGGEDPTR